MHGSKVRGTYLSLTQFSKSNTISRLCSKTFNKVHFLSIHKSQNDSLPILWHQLCQKKFKLNLNLSLTQQEPNDLQKLKPFGPELRLVFMGHAKHSHFKLIKILIRTIYKGYLHCIILNFTYLTPYLSLNII